MKDEDKLCDILNRIDWEKITNNDEIELDDWKDAVILDQFKNQAKVKRPTANDDMAQRIMDALCENGQGDFLLLRDDEIREWWTAVTKQREAERRKKAAARRKAELRASGLSKLTAEERNALGLK